MTRAFHVLLLAVLCVGAGYMWGGRASDHAWQAKEAERLQAQASEREAEIRRGEKASGALQAELLARSITSDQLQKAFNDLKRRQPLVVSRCPVGQRQARPEAAQPSEPEVLAVPIPVRDDPALTHGAVWMWNSALHGHSVPSGACGHADAPEGACSAATDLTVDDAWDNHAINARICAETRTRYQHLIDYINKKGTPQ